MSSLKDLVQERRSEINDVVRKHHGSKISLFGSVARGDDSEVSDLDFLVEFDSGSDLFDIMRLQDDLEELLGTHVDVISAGGLKERDSHIREESVPL